MRFSLHRFSRMVLAGLLLSLGACVLRIPTTLEPTGSRIGPNLLLEEIDVRVVPLPNNSFALMRVDPDDHGYLIEGYDTAFAPIWRHAIPFDRLHRITPVSFSASRDAVTLLYTRYEYDDTITIMGTILDPSTGTLRETRRLSGRRFDPRQPDVGNRMLVYSPDSTLFAFYQYDYSRLKEDSSKTVGLVADLFDMRLNQRGSRRIEIPVADHVEDVETADWWVHNFFLSNEGHGYQVSYHDTATLRLTRIDFAGGSERMLETRLPLVDFHNGKPLIGTRGWSAAGGEVIVASNIAQKKALQGIVLVGMNFQKNTIDFINVTEIDPKIPRALRGGDALNDFRVREVIRMPGGEIVVPVEQVVTTVVDSWQRSAKNPPMFAYGPTTYVHKDLVIFGFDRLGRPLWNVGQRRYSDPNSDPGYRADSWRIENDSIHYIYSRDSIARSFNGIATREYMTGSIATRTGAMTPPRHLLKTAMSIDPRYTIWRGRHDVILVLKTYEHLRVIGMTF